MLNPIFLEKNIQQPCQNLERWNFLRIRDNQTTVDIIHHSQTIVFQNDTLNVLLTNQILTV